MKRVVLMCSLLIGGFQDLYSQVVMRDTLVEWRHFDYSLNEFYSIDSYSNSSITTSQFEGFVLENELVKITIIPGFGARIISFVYKPTGHEQLYQNPVGVPYAINQGIFYHDWLMVYAGIFPTFPEPEHGKYWNVPWNFEFTEQSEDQYTLSMWMKDDLNNPSHPGQYNNGSTGITCYFDVSLEKGKPYFTTDVRLVNDEVADNYEYWTCITYAPGSDIGATETPGNSEMIVPIETYQVGWNPGNWMNNLDEVVSSGNPRVQKFENLALLSNWEDQGIAYAYPDLSAPYYGVINHTNEEGIFRLSNDQSKTPGMKFWTWGDGPGQSADPSNFHDVERPYIELWSGVSQEFFEDAYLGANETIEWRETFVPTIGIPDVSYMNEEITFFYDLNETQLELYSFLPVAQGYEVEVSVSQASSEVYYNSYVPNTNQSTAYNETISFSEMGANSGEYSIEIQLLTGDSLIWKDINTFNAITLNSPKPLATTFVRNGNIEIQFVNSSEREVAIYDLRGILLFHKETNIELTIPVNQNGLHLVRIKDGNQVSTQKVWVH